MNWQDRLKQNICTVSDLKKHFKLTKKQEDQLLEVTTIHPMNITKYQLSLINKKDPKDPIKKLIVPSSEELNEAGLYDTSGEKSNTKSKGLQHKYQQTAVILATNRCAAYCRFCFRKRLVGLSNNEILERFTATISYIKKHKEINNILITGGDPLVLPTHLINKILRKLSPIKQLDFIRFGSRIPVAFPYRILDDPKLLKTLQKYSKKDRRIYVVTHFNHPNEITKQSIEAVNKLLEAGVVVNNQTVLLKGVNDDPDVLAKLLNSLTGIGVTPYYVFQCRPVKRVKTHFQVPFYRGIKIVEDAKKQLNGHGKRFKFCMSHKTGKIEIVGKIGNDIYFKYHQAKNPKNLGKMFKKRLNRTAGWLDDFK